MVIDWYQSVEINKTKKYEDLVQLYKMNDIVWYNIFIYIYQSGYFPPKRRKNEKDIRAGISRTISEYLHGEKRRCYDGCRKKYQTVIRSKRVFSER